MRRGAPCLHFYLAPYYSTFRPDVPTGFLSSGSSALLLLSCSSFVGLTDPLCGPTLDDVEVEVIHPGT